MPLGRFAAVFAFLITCCAAPPPPVERFVTTSDGARLHMLDWGGRGETIVLLAGLSNTAYIYCDLAPRLTRSFRVIAITRRGHGHSGETRDYTPAAQARDVHDVLDALGIRRVHLAGHSLAGSELTEFASRYPDRTASLIYLDAAYDRKMQSELDSQHEDPVPWKPPTAAELSSPQSYLAYRQRRDALPGAYYGLIWSAAVAADARDEFDRERTNRAEYGRFFAAAAASAPDYSRIEAPILAIYAETSRYPHLPPHAGAELRRKADDYHRQVIAPWTEASIRELRRAQPAATIIEMPETLHHVFVQYPERVASLIASHAAAAASRSSVLHGRPAARPRGRAMPASTSSSVNARQGSPMRSAASSSTRRKRIPSAACARMCGLPMREMSRGGDPTTPAARIVTVFSSAIAWRTARSAIFSIGATSFFTATCASGHGSSITS